MIYLIVTPNNSRCSDPKAFDHIHLAGLALTIFALRDLPADGVNLHKEDKQTINPMADSLLRYWEIDDNNGIDVAGKIPYRIELVGVTCDTGLAVARGIWRKIRTGRSVPVPSQLRSHRLFAENFENFANAADSATLYHTGKQWFRILSLPGERDSVGYSISLWLAA